jgi:hypothetical protein
MNYKTLGGLVVLNIALLVSLVLLTLSPAPAQAQFGSNRAGDYVMLGLAAPGRQAYNAVIIVDMNNAAMLSVRYDPSSRRIVPIAFRNIARDSEGRQSR